MYATDIPSLDARGLRRFGLTTGAILAGLFGLFFPLLLNRPLPLWPWILSALLIVWALTGPRTMRPLYRAWMRVGMVIGSVTTPIILTAFFFLAVFPTSIVMRLFRHDPLRRKFDQAETYRVPSRQPVIKNLGRPF